MSIRESLSKQDFFAPPSKCEVRRRRKVRALYLKAHPEEIPIAMSTSFHWTQMAPVNYTLHAAVDLEKAHGLNLAELLDSVASALSVRPDLLTGCTITSKEEYEWGHSPAYVEFVRGFCNTVA